MSNPFDPTYLATASNQFGPFAWLFFALQLAAALGGLYILYVRTDTNAVRRALWRQLGVALLVVGAIGLVLGVLRLANVPIFNQRYWFYIELLVEVIMAIYIFYYARTTYPRLIAASQPSRSRPGPVRRGSGPDRPARNANAQDRSTRPVAPQQVRADASDGPRVPAPPALSSRREARRGRKRRSR